MQGKPFKRYSSQWIVAFFGILLGADEFAPSEEQQLLQDILSARESRG